MSRKAQKSSLIKRIGPMPVLIGVLFFSLAFRVSDTVEQGRDLLAQDTISFASATAQETVIGQNANPPAMPTTATTTDETLPAVDNVFGAQPEISDRNFIEDSDFSSSEVEILQSLVKRREELRQKERVLNQKEALLAAAEKQIESKMVELTSLRGEIEGLLGKQQTEQEDRIKSLVKMYETMKPKDAARIFDTLEEDVLLSVISKMSERKAAPILASMNAERARLVTIKLAEQKRLPVLPIE